MYQTHLFEESPQVNLLSWTKHRTCGDLMLCCWIMFYLIFGVNSDHFKYQKDGLAIKAHLALCLGPTPSPQFFGNPPGPLLLQSVMRHEISVTKVKGRCSISVSRQEQEEGSCQGGDSWHYSASQPTDPRVLCSSPPTISWSLIQKLSSVCINHFVNHVILSVISTSPL